LRQLAELAAFQLSALGLQLDAASWQSWRHWSEIKRGDDGQQFGGKCLPNNQQIISGQFWPFCTDFEALSEILKELRVEIVLLGPRKKFCQLISLR
jgi:hypothetical protein